MISEVKTKNQLVLLSGILVLMATATIAASNIVQPANAAYGKDIIAPRAQAGDWGSQVSAGAQDPNTPHNGLADYRANGDKYDPSTGQNYVGPGNNGNGGPNFRP